MTRTKPAISRPVVLTRALREFLATEVAGGVVLLAATAVALAWANSPWDGSYRRLWETELALRLGQWSIALDLRHWVNEGLMAIFFVVVGLEIKRELFEGELRDRRQAALPVIAAVGGMAVPAAIYLALNPSGPDARGWGIPMATDIAFALGVAALVGRRLPSSLRLFLLTLAIVDDIGAILVIALFYSGGIGWGPLTAALVLIAAAYAVRQAGVLFPPLFVTFGALVWLALHQSGLHATLAGVAMGLLAPTRPRLSREIMLTRGDELLDVFSPEAARTTSRLARLSVSPMEWLEHLLHPWTSLLVLPVFALANAGVSLSAGALDHAFRSTVTWGVVVGLVVGKPLGIAIFSWMACRLGLASLPNEARWRELVGVGALGGIGFTISLFVTDLAFDQSALVEEAKVGILASSLVASLAGAALLALSSRGRGPHPPRSPSRSSRR